MLVRSEDSGSLIDDMRFTPWTVGYYRSLGLYIPEEHIIR